MPDDDAYLGQIEIFAFDRTPDGWAPCDGRLLPISQNYSLFSLLGTQFGGDGVSTFALPDLRSRTSIGQTEDAGRTFYPVGERAGEEMHALTAAETTYHSHNLIRGAQSGPHEEHPHARRHGDPDTGDRDRRQGQSGEDRHVHQGLCAENGNGPHPAVGTDRRRAASKHDAVSRAQCVHLDARSRPQGRLSSARPPLDIAADVPAREALRSGNNANTSFLKPLPSGSTPPRVIPRRIWGPTHLPSQVAARSLQHTLFRGALCQARQRVPEFTANYRLMPL